LSSPVTLAQAQEAAQRGDWRRAYALCVQLAAADPANKQARLCLASAAETPEAAIAAFSEALNLNPADPTARQGLYVAMQGLLRQDAFLAYQGETQTAYRISTKRGFQFAHPKDRAAPELFPPAEPAPTHPAQRWLAWALIGLVPAGVGAVLCAPVAAVAALRLRRHPRPEVRARQGHSRPGSCRRTDWGHARRAAHPAPRITPPCLRALVLALLWLIFSAVITLLRGARLRRGSAGRSAVWLAAVILAGDLWALLTFGRPGEIAVLSAVAWLHGLGWSRRLPHWNGLGQATWSFSMLAALLYLAYSFAVMAFTPLHPLGFVLSCALFLTEALALGLSLSFTYETLEAGARWRWPHRYAPARPIPAFAPKVSLHVPSYNEPPEVLTATLRALAQLDYSNFEVLLVDNNTPDEATWRPLEALCQQLGPHFKCLHLDRWPGYKSGALNFALTQTAPDAEIIGIIDADYLVRPEFLRDTVPYFSNPRVAFLQTPQDYREHEGNAYLEACYDAYKYLDPIQNKPAMPQNCCKTRRFRS